MYHDISAAPMANNNNLTRCQRRMQAIEESEDGAAQIVMHYMKRVQDWKGLCLCHFGDPLLVTCSRIARPSDQAHHGDGIPNNTSAVSPSSYRVMLFQNYILCCKKSSIQDAKGRDLRLKGRVLLRDIHDVQPIGNLKLNIPYTSAGVTDSFLMEFTQAATRALWLDTLEYHVARASAATTAALRREDPDYLPTYYSPLPDYAQITELSAPLMQRASPPISPLGEPPMYTPLPTPELPTPARTTFNFDFAFPTENQRMCRPAIVSNLSSSTIASQNTTSDESEGGTSSDEQDEGLRDHANSDGHQLEHLQKQSHSFLPLYILFPGFAVASFFIFASYASLSV